MHLDARGHPLHTRALGVVLTHRNDAKLDAQAYLLDVRKCGLVPVGADLHSPGVLHHMLLRAVIDPVTAAIESIAAEQPNVAFEPSAFTEGESCRDPTGRIAALARTPLDADFGRRVSAAVGGPRGCSHILTLTHFMASVVSRALTQDRARYGVNPRRRPGERVFRADLVADGCRMAAGRVALAIQLAELHLAPSPALSRPMERFAGHLDVRALVEVSVPAFQIIHVEAAERSRRLEDLDRAVWRDRHDTVAQLCGLPLWAGGTAELIRRLGQEAADRPLLDTLLLIGPTLVQCGGALSESWPLLARDSPSLLGIAGIPDSCYMWRCDGALHRSRRPDDPVPSV